ncbi:MAG: hypothetical protein FJ303_21625 [Planctomycetes bacterium]|nr:hypothetical protein [Planctomycetota bacterium]
MFHLAILASLILPGNSVETARYVRLGGKQAEFECEITHTKTKTGTTINSVTGRGAGKLTLTARYDAEDNLLSADAMRIIAGEKATATVTVKDGKAIVKRQTNTETVDIAKGIIVTSAPDWTDIWLMCRRYDRAKGGKQTFPGLWIHPVENTGRWDFTIEKAGDDVIEHDGKKRTLDRFTVTIRNASQYVAWADDRGRLIKLVPKNTKMPYAIVLDGHETSSLQLIRP